MTFLNRFKYAALAVLLLVAILASCEKDPTTIGAGVVGSTPFKTDKAVFDVFAYNKSIVAVNANKLPVYQLGSFNDAVYGQTEAMVTSQVRLPNVNPVFGALSQSAEDGADSDSSPTTIPENEKIDSVYLYIPFLTNPTGDADLDGLIDELDLDPNDANSDTDGDGLTDNQEKTKGTDPLIQDTDGDGIGDAEDNDFNANQFKRSFDLDSIYVDGKLYDSKRPDSITFNLKVQRSTYFLRDLDPNTNFQQAQEYFSSQQFAPTFVDSILFNGSVTINTEQIPLKKRDDPATEDIDEREQNDYLAPGIRVALEKEFFQHNILDLEGGSELSSQANFDDFLRGIHFSLTSNNQEVMFLFDLKAANMTISYSYDTADTAGVVTEGGGSRDFTLRFIQQPVNSQGQISGAVQGNAVNTLLRSNGSGEVADNLDTGENASKIYLKGGPGSYAEVKLFDENDENSQEIISQIEAKNWIVNEANLVFYVANDNLAEEPPLLYLYNAETKFPLFDSPTSQNDLAVKFFDYDGNLVKSADGKGVKYTVKITEHINNLLIREAENVTLGLTLTPSLLQSGVANAMLDDNVEDEIPIASTLTPLGTVLFGSNVAEANADKKLQLEIFYTETN